MEALLHIQGDASSDLTPLFLVHAISGLALPYLSLGSLSDNHERPVYGISSPFYVRKSYTLPTTLDLLAQEYIDLIQNEVQPHGPYLLGGWSMGGMIAVRMAALLEAQGETVLHVILIDAANPEEIPEFEDNEHNILTSLTFEFLARGLGVAVRPEMKRAISESSSANSSDDKDDMWDIFDTDTLDSDSEAEDEDEDEFDNAVSMVEWLLRMRKHIFNGLALIASKEGSKYGAVTALVSLIKCGTLDPIPPTLSAPRKHAIRKLHVSPKSGWRLPQMRTLSIPMAAHNRVLDAEHAGDLTMAMKAVLDEVSR